MKKGLFVIICLFLFLVLGATGSQCEETKLIVRDKDGLREAGSVFFFYELVWPGYGNFVYPFLKVHYTTHTHYTPGSIPKVPACLKETHLEVTDSPAGIPQKEGKPAIKNFTFSEKHDCVTGFTYAIPMDLNEGQILYTAAHAKVKVLDYLQDIQTALPESMYMAAVSPGDSGKPSYFDIQLFGENILDGRYEGWSADGNGIIDSPCSARVFSSYEYPNIPVEAVSIRYNLDLVNWVLNQHFVGRQSTGKFGINTWADVQYAIWKLIEFPNNQYVTHLTQDAIDSLMNLYSSDRVREIVNAALTRGEGFVPMCNDQMAIVVAPKNGAQTAILQARPKDLVKPCSTNDGNAWAYGNQTNSFPFPGDPDASYFVYQVEPPIGE